MNLAGGRAHRQQFHKLLRILDGFVTPCFLFHVSPVDGMPTPHLFGDMSALLMPNAYVNEHLKESILMPGK
jgi:hypothetical protein